MTEISGSTPFSPNRKPALGGPVGYRTPVEILTNYNLGEWDQEGGSRGGRADSAALCFPVNYSIILTCLLNRVEFLIFLPLLHFKCAFAMYADIVFIRTQCFPGWFVGWEHLKTMLKTIRMLIMLQIKDGHYYILCFFKDRMLIKILLNITSKDISILYT